MRASSDVRTAGAILRGAAAASMRGYGGRTCLVGRYLGTYSVVRPGTEPRTEAVGSAVLLINPLRVPWKAGTRGLSQGVQGPNPNNRYIFRILGSYYPRRKRGGYIDVKRPSQRDFGNVS